MNMAPSHKKSPRNRGFFKPGYDRRRHILTKEERSRGYWHAMYFSMSMRITSYVFYKVRGYYRAQRAGRTKGD
jgi:hypothetical protein